MRLIFIIGIVLLVLFFTLGAKMFFSILLSLLVIYFIFFYVYHKKYKICVVVAETGGGKTLYCNSIVQKYVKENKKIQKKNLLFKKLGKELLPEYNIYTTYKTKGAKLLKGKFFKYQYPENSILVVDEAQMTFDSRKFSQAVKNGDNDGLLGALSMHRHHKLDLYFISQQTDEIDVRIRRYCNELITIDNLIYFRKFYFWVEKKFGIKTKTRPLVLIYHKWKKVSDYETWLENRKNNNYMPKQFGAKLCFKVIKSIDLDTYDSHQLDTFYSSLQKCGEESWEDKDALLDTGVSIQNK